MDNKMNKPIALTPPMGWNSWNTFTWDINEKMICEMADRMVEDGYLEAGYEYLVIDDCWSLKQRDADGNLVPDPEKFPHGMKWVSDYVHEKGLKFGMYSCAGTHTCAGYPGSFEHEFQDAKKFAEWGVDYLKYDYCFKPRQIPGEILYKRMSLALKNCGREILFAACNWGTDGVYDWIRSSGAHTYRSTGDIQDNWESITNLAISQMGKEPYTGNFCHNDMDMLVVGMHGASNDGFIGSKIGGCTDQEYLTHFALWAIMGSPLIMGCDLRKASEETKKTLLNKDLIAINQDLEARGAYVIKPLPDWFNENEAFILVKPLADGDLAIGLFNFGDGDGSITLAGGWAYSIPENSDNKDLTMEFIEQLNTYDAYKTYIMQAGNTSVRTDIAEDEDYASQPFMTQAAEFLDVAAFRPQNDQYSTVSTSIQQMVEAVASGDTPENAMKQYATSVANAVGEENTTKQ